MINSNSLFHSYYLEKNIEKQSFNNIENVQEKLKIIGKWKKGIEEKTIYKFNEKQLQGSFLNDFFNVILGYENSYSSKEINLISELSTKIDGSTPDGVLGFFTNNEHDIQCVIELKDAKTDLDVKQKRKNDNRTPVEQAFSYAPKNGIRCKWIIVSNFCEIRLYHALSQLEYEKFEITNLLKEKEFLKFYYLLNRRNLIQKTGNSLIEELYISNLENTKNITKEFYKDYSAARSELIKSILNNNKNISISCAIEKVQKIIDRIIFICFCKDSVDSLLPYNILSRVFNPKEDPLNLIWEDLKTVFNAIDIGKPEKDINRYNGGLFKEDIELNSLIFPDEDIKHLMKIAKYNFHSEMDVNILGHVFEQNISDIQKIKLNLGVIQKNLVQNKRKQDGVYYTPESITNYIVSETIKTWLESKRTELGYYMLPELSEEEKEKVIEILRSGRKVAKKRNSNNSLLNKYNKILKFWEEYRKKLFNIKIIDISCGSGAFLNQAFTFLYREGQKVNNIIYSLIGEQVKYFIDGKEMYLELDRNILCNNLYGIDKSKESVEVTKLSLWLKTANKNKALTSLDNNIFYGNSIISDNSVVGDEAFNWEQNFQSIMENGGFDIVIGNPPYIDSETMVKNMPEVRDYCKKNYASAKGNWDMFIPFIERGLKILNEDGILGYIIPNKLIGSTYSEEIRRTIAKYRILQFRDLSNLKVFDDADVYPVVFLVQNNHSKVPVKIEVFNSKQNKWKENIIDEKIFYRDIYWDRYFTEHSIIVTIIEKMLNFKKLINYAEVKEAATVSEAYDIKKHLVEQKNINDPSMKYYKLINTGTIDKYQSLWENKETRYLKSKYNSPIILEKDIKTINSIRQQEASKEKIIVGGISREFEGFYDSGDYLAGKSTTIIFDSIISLKYILGLLNSKLITFFYNHYFKSMSLSGEFYRLSSKQIKQIPIAYSQLMENKVSNKAETIQERKRLNHDTKSLEKEIDDIVYELYSITKEELEFIEEYFINNNINPGNH